MATDLTPVTRLEKILANLTGEAYDITPVTRIEKLFDNLLDGSYAIIPATRIEKFISDLKEAGYDLTAVTRIEKFLNKTAAEAGLVPVTRLEKFLDAIEAGPVIDWGNPYPGSVYEPLQNNLYLAANGIVTTNNGWDLTEYVYCKGAAYIQIDKPSGTAPSVPNGQYGYFYDADKNVINTLLSNITTPNNSYHKRFSVPSNAVYFRLSEKRAQIQRLVDGTITITPYKE